MTETVNKKDCFLCGKFSENRDRDNFIFYRGEVVSALLNLYPYNSGHVLVVPYTHIGDLEALDSEISVEMWKLTSRVVQALKEEYRPGGFNVGLNLGRSAGAGLPEHIHIHIVPRWDGDTNYMSVINDTKVLPETLDTTYQRLSTYF